MREVSPRGQSDEDVNRKFKAAWLVFAETCRETRVNEATYQVWFAVYLVSQFGIDRVIREPDFDPRRSTSPLRDLFVNETALRLDVAVAREPRPNVPHRALRDKAEQALDPEHPELHVGGFDLIEKLDIISELKVTATQQGGVNHTSVIRDLQKLSLFLEQADQRGHNERMVGLASWPAPQAYFCLLDNGRGKSSNFRATFDWDHLHTRLEKLTESVDGTATHGPIDPRICVLGAPEGFQVPKADT